jgi:hypothetical protein
MSVLADVFDAVRRGVPASRVAATLDIDPGLAESALDHWIRLGLVTDAGDLSLGCTGCGTDHGTTPVTTVPNPGAKPRMSLPLAMEKSPSCGACPFSR